VAAVVTTPGDRDTGVGLDHFDIFFLFLFFCSSLLELWLLDELMLPPVQGKIGGMLQKRN
jgi:hypothetical protein